MEGAARAVAPLAAAAGLRSAAAQGASAGAAAMPMLPLLAAFHLLALAAVVVVGVRAFADGTARALRAAPGATAAAAAASLAVPLIAAPDGAVAGAVVMLSVLLPCAVLLAALANAASAAAAAAARAAHSGCAAACGLSTWAVLTIFGAVPVEAGRKKGFAFYSLHIPGSGYAVFTEWDACVAHGCLGASCAWFKGYQTFEAAKAAVTMHIDGALLDGPDIWYDFVRGPVPLKGPAPSPAANTPGSSAAHAAVPPTAVHCATPPPVLATTLPMAGAAAPAPWLQMTPAMATAIFTAALAAAAGPTAAATQPAAFVHPSAVVPLTTAAAATAAVVTPAAAAPPAAPPPTLHTALHPPIASAHPAASPIYVVMHISLIASISLSDLSACFHTTATSGMSLSATCLFALMLVTSVSSHSYFTLPFSSL